MILRITIRDNDFTQVIEEYLDKCSSDGYGLVMYKWNKAVDNKEDYHAINEAFDEVEIARQALHGDDVITYIRIFRDCFLSYIKDNYDNDRYNYIEKNLKITSIKSLSCTDQNGKVVYLFPNHRKYITM